MSKSGDPELNKVEEWLTRYKIAGSALGRHVCGEHALMSRWRSNRKKVTDTKRAQILQFIAANPNGIEGYDGPRGRRRGHKLSNPRRVAHAPSMGGDSTNNPVPALSECNDAEWIRKTATLRRMPIVRFLAELVTLGIMVYRDNEAEEALTQQTGGTDGTSGIELPRS